MVLCKYFLSGSCKYGNNCSFEHPASQNVNPASRYKYVNPTYNKTTNQPTLDHDVTQYIDLVKTDAFQWLNSSQWKFSCYSPFNNDKSISLFEEYSAEELRYETYKSRQTNTFNQTIDEINKKKNTTINYLKEIMTLTPQIRDILIQYYDEIKSPKNMSIQVTQTSTTNKFADLVQKESLLNAFANSSKVASNGNIFSLATNQSQAAQATKLLGSLSANSQNAFTKTPSHNQFTQLCASQTLSKQQQQHQQILPNPFTQLSNKIDFGKQLEQSDTALFPFGQATQNKVEQNVFTNEMNQQNSNNITANLQSTSVIVTQPSINNNNNNNNAFSALMLKNINSNNQIQSSYYSNKSEFNDQDIQEYSATYFTLGKIPILPPSKDFC